MIFVHLGGEGDSELANLIGLRERLGNEVEDVDPNELGNGLVMTIIGNHKVVGDDDDDDRIVMMTKMAIQFFGRWRCGRCWARDPPQPQPQ